MIRVFLIDDEPLVLIGMQGMLDWAALGYEVVGTARNGGEALPLIGQTRPDIVVTDIRMPVMDGLELLERCRRQDAALPVFIMLTSYEEFDYVKRSLSLGAVEYLVKMELSAESLRAALDRARQAVEKESALRAPAQQAGSLTAYRDRLFLQLYGGLFTDRAMLDRVSGEVGLRFDAPAYAAALAEIQGMPPAPDGGEGPEADRLVAFSAGVTGMAAKTMPRYLPCWVTGMDLRHFSVLISLQAEEELRPKLVPVLQKTEQILHNYFNVHLQWAVGRPVQDILKIGRSQQDAFAALPLLGAEQPVLFCADRANPQLDHRAQLVAQVQQYIRDNLDKRLSLNEVAAVFNFSPNYLSQLFARSGEHGYVEFVTATRIEAAKQLMASTDLKVYEISERIGFENAFYFSRVFKKLEGVSPREYIQKVRN